MENQQPEALILVNDRLSAIGDDLYQWALDAEDMIRRLHARVQELEKDRGNAKRLVSKIWNQHPEARDTIEKATGAWLVFGQDVETGGVSAQRVTQAKDHIAQDRKMVSAPVVLPDGWKIVPVEPTPPMVEAGATERITPHITAGHGAIAAFKAMLEHAPEYPALASTTADARAAERVDALYKALEVCSAELFAQCAHQGRAMKYVEQARKALAAEQCARAAIEAAKEN